ncbi:ABC transporter substrate-binding protein [Hymenobacter sp. HMF4947]|uniref:ABC transporter substrate-binding protein n=1 Tax=Hymenobacter ginkgonis TaxID=2682976 RepID=A0A7K1TI85_9BACT|nr:ABC transporter substrate-binding protein [Hymenobacter ginkgonis]MVN77861.1 ABC transporter substrate-binding protein [Hymenobacter ginkgonis]
MRFSLLLPGLLAGLLACQPQSKPAATPATVVVHDDLGRTLTLLAHPRRVVSLAPSLTEILYAVADTATIIARTQADDYPAAVLRKPVVNSYPLDLERLVALHPDVVFTVEGLTPLDAAERLRQLGIPVYYQKYRRVADVLRGINDVGRLLGRSAQAHRLTDSLQQQLQLLVSPIKTTGKPLAVLALASADPIYVYGQNTLFTDEIRLAGGQNAVRDTFPQPFPALTREYVLKLNPEVLLGGRFGKMDSTFFKNNPELRRTSAYQRRRVYATTPNLLQRPSPRIVEAVRELQKVLKNN